MSVFVLIMGTFLGIGFAQADSEVFAQIEDLTSSPENVLSLVRKQDLTIAEYPHPFAPFSEESLMGAAVRNGRLDILKALYEFFGRPDVNTAPSGKIGMGGLLATGDFLRNAGLYYYSFHFSNYAVQQFLKAMGGHFSILLPEEMFYEMLTAPPNVIHQHIRDGFNINRVYAPLLENRSFNSLQIAVTTNSAESVRALLQAGARVTLNAGELTRTAATLNAHSGVITELVNNGYSLNAPEGDSSLMAACSNRNHVAVVRELLSLGANIHQQDRRGLNALHLAVAGLVERPKTRRVTANAVDLETVRTLVAAGVAIDARTNDGRSALALAVGNRDEKTAEVAAALIRHGADVHAIDQNKKTILMEALKSESNFLKVLEVLNPSLENLNAKNADQYTVLMLAVFMSSPEGLVSRLLEKGADKTLKDSKGRTAFDLAMCAQRPKALLNLLKTPDSRILSERDCDKLPWPPNPGAGVSN